MKISTANHTKALTAFCAAALLACFGFSPSARADGHTAIVGLWAVHYVSTSGGPEVLTFDQWHSDGQEIETANISLGAICQGTYRRAGERTFQLHHVAWTFDSNQAYSGYWDEQLGATVSQDGKSYSGTYARKFYDTNNNFLFEDDGTLTANKLTPRE